MMLPAATPFDLFLTVLSIAVVCAVAWFAWRVTGNLWLPLAALLAGLGPRIATLLVAATGSGVATSASWGSLLFLGHVAVIWMLAWVVYRLAREIEDERRRMLRRGSR